jgi:uncharacterized protein (DUF2141 family)
MNPRIISIAIIATSVALGACSDDDRSGTPSSACLASCAAGKPALCETPDLLVTYFPTGICGADDVCAFGEARVGCANGCSVSDDGVAACTSAPDDACAGIVCDSPPSACHAPAGLCSGGTCTYAALPGLPCDDGDACTSDDVCDAAASCVGTVVACQTPAPSVCDGDTLVVSSSNGTCVDGGCSYTTTRVPCDEGCADGACLGDPCINVTCDAPPSPCHAATGTCRDGVCDYDYDNGAPCDDAQSCTDNDVCNNGVCAGTNRVCNTPPAATCADGDTLSRPAASGTCNGGTCSYTTTTASCEFGCTTQDDVGACAGDPCAFVTCTSPPPATCADANTLTTRSAVGTCSAGACTYAAANTACAHGCGPATATEPARCLPPAGLLIAEFAYDSAGSPDTETFVELVGPPGMSLDGVAIVGVNGNGGAVYHQITLSGTIGARGRYVVAHPQSSGAILAAADMLDSKVDYQNGPDSIQLRYGAVVLDAVAYGTFGSGDVPAGEGAPAMVAGVGLSLSRDRSDSDSNNNAVDFRAVAPTPGTAAFWPEVAPDIEIACPTSGAPGETLTFAGTALEGTIATWRFDFGDGSPVVTQEGATATHAYATAGTRTVTVTATTSGGQSDVATCQVVVELTETPATWNLSEVCGGSGYQYAVVSDPVPATTDGRLTVRFKGLSQYGVNGYSVEIQTGASSWATAAVTVPSKAEWQTHHFTVDQGLLNQAMTAMGWLRFRWSPLSSGASDNCVQIALSYNCTACFECPAGQVDLGIGCQSTTANYDYTALEHPRGLCANSTRDALYLPGTPSATGDGTLTVDSLGCGSASVTMRIFTQNSGWVDVGTGSGGNCSYGRSTWTVPAAYLRAAVDTDNRIRFRWSISDTCVPGVGCSAHSDPCVKNLRLVFPR